MARPSTLSPRCSTRSWESVRSPAHEMSLKRGMAPFFGSSSISWARSAFARLRLRLVARDVVDGLPDSLDPLGVFVRDLDPELILQPLVSLERASGVTSRTPL